MNVLGGQVVWCRDRNNTQRLKCQTESEHHSICKATSTWYNTKQQSQLRKATLYTLGSMTVMTLGQGKLLDESQEKTHAD